MLDSLTLYHPNKMMGRYNFNTTIIQKFVRSALGTQNLRSIVLAPLGLVGTHCHFSRRICPIENQATYLQNQTAKRIIDVW